MSDALARSTDPATSHAAAAAVSVHLNALEQRVYVALWARGSVGATTKELAELTGLDRVTVSPRIKPLVEKGKVKASPIRRGKSIVWWAV